MAVDTSDYFATAGIYNAEEQAPSITDAGAQALYGVQTAQQAQGKYAVEWQAGTYRTQINGSDALKEGDEARAAGTHYYRIVDIDTGTVICYKHAYVIKPDTVTAVSTGNRSGASFTWNEDQISITLTGTNSNETTSTATYHKGTIAGLMSKLGVSFGSSQALTDTVEPGPSALFELFANEVEFLNNHAVQDADKITYTASYSYTALATAYSTPDGSAKTHYGTILDALNTTYSTSTTVVALQGFTNGNKTYTAGVNYHHTIDEDCTVASNVTLLIPYGTDFSGYYNASSREYSPTLIATQSSTTGGDTYVEDPRSAYKQGDTYLKNVITVKAEKTLTNNGSIIIPGIVTGGTGGEEFSSVTFSDHSRINLESNARIESADGAASIICHGYIDKKGEGAKVLMSKGNIDMILSIVEHKGGTAFSGVIMNYQASPFNRFYVESVTADLVVCEGATATALIDLYISGHQKTEVDLFGTTSKSFIQFDPDAKKSQATMRYDPAADQNELILEGDISVNKLLVDTNYGTISTEKVFLPLSHYWSIDFCQYNAALGYADSSCTVNAEGQDIKILPGCTVTIGENVTFSGKNIAVYPANANIPTVINNSYYAKADGTAVAQTAGVLCVKGSLSAAALGGYVQVDGENATLYIGATSVSSKEVSDASFLQAKYVDNTLTPTGNVATSDTAASVTALRAASTYTSLGSAWFQPFVTVTLDPNGGTAGTTSTELVVDKELGVYNSATGAPDLSRLNGVQPPTKENYSFSNIWYLDAACTKPLAEHTTEIRYATTLYAGWNMKVNLLLDTAGGTATDSAGNTLTAKEITLNVDDVVEILQGINITLSGNRFLGWFMEDGTAVSNEKFTEEAAGSDRQITIHAQWELLEVSVDLTLDYLTNANGKDFGDVALGNMVSTCAPEDVVTLPTAHAADAKQNVQWYLSHWVDANGETVTSVTMGTENVTVYAVWQSKIYLEYKSSNGNNAYTDLVPYGKTWYMPGEPVSVTLPNVELYDMVTNDSTKCYYFSEWSIGSEYGSADTFVFTESTTVEITWATKHMVSIDIKITNSSCNGSITVNGVTYNKDNPSQTLFFHPTKQEVTIGSYSLTGYSGFLGIIGKKTTTLTVSGGITINDSTSSSTTGTGGKVTLSKGGTTTIKITHN